MAKNFSNKIQRTASSARRARLKSMCNYMWNISEPSFEADGDCETREFLSREIIKFTVTTCQSRALVKCQPTGILVTTFDGTCTASSKFLPSTFRPEQTRLHCSERISISAANVLHGCSLSACETKMKIERREFLLSNKTTNFQVNFD